MRADAVSWQPLKWLAGSKLTGFWQFVSSSSRTWSQLLLDPVPPPGGTGCWRRRAQMWAAIVTASVLRTSSLALQRAQTRHSSSTWKRGQDQSETVLVVRSTCLSVRAMTLSAELLADCETSQGMLSSLNHGTSTDLWLSENLHCSCQEHDWEKQIAPMAW